MISLWLKVILFFLHREMKLTAENKFILNRRCILSGNYFPIVLILINWLSTIIWLVFDYHIPVLNKCRDWNLKIRKLNQDNYLHDLINQVIGKLQFFSIMLFAEYLNFLSYSRQAWTNHEIFVFQLEPPFPLEFTENIFTKDLSQEQLKWKNISPAMFFYSWCILFLQSELTRKTFIKFYVKICKKQRWPAD